MVGGGRLKTAEKPGLAIPKTVAVSMHRILSPEVPCLLTPKPAFSAVTSGGLESLIGPSSP